MNDDRPHPSATPDRADEAPDPELERQPGSEATEEAHDESESSGSKLPSTPILVLGFVIVALLGVVIFQNALPPAGGEAKAADSPAMETLRADIETRRAMLNRERIALGMEPIGGSSLGSESADDVAARLKTDAETLASLSGSFQELLVRKESELDGARAETVAALREQKRLRELLDTANRDLRQSMIDASAANSLRTELEAERRRITALQDELSRLRAEPGALRQQLAAAENARDAAEARAAQLEQELARLRAESTQADLFATGEDEIVRGAIQLFRSLRQLEGRSESEISSAYSKFGVELGANVLKTCTFETGSSTVGPELEAALRQLPDEIPDRALIFVVGYASETGNVDDNRQLSSDRATHVARILDLEKRGSQRVQAVYLGQTDRFSSRVPQRNQIVEIWQIVPKLQ